MCANHNQIATLTGFGPLPALIGLELNHNRITSFDGLGLLPKLFTLELSYNGLKAMEGMDGLTRLCKLDLQHNQIDSMKGVRAVRSLRHLNLDHNQLERIEDLRSTQLYTLKLSHNRLKRLPNLNVKLDALLLQNNQIEGVEDFIGLIALRVLDLRDNKLQSVAGLFKKPTLGLRTPEPRTSSKPFILKISGNPALKASLLSSLRQRDVEIL